MMKNLGLLYAFLTIQCLSNELNIEELLSDKNISEAISMHHDKGVRIVGGIELTAPQGNIVFDEDLVLLAKWLQHKKQFPTLEDLGGMLEHKNIAVRVFAINCLKLKIGNLPEFNPYFPPGHQNITIRAIHRRIEPILKRQ